MMFVEVELPLKMEKRLKVFNNLVKNENGFYAKNGQFWLKKNFLFGYDGGILNGLNSM